MSGLKSFTILVVSELTTHAHAVSYAAVADALVASARARGVAVAGDVDKNIRRRVYDALNVLVSMGFVERNGKLVKWRASSSHVQQHDKSCDRLGAQIREIRNRVQQKRETRTQIAADVHALEWVVRRNAARDRAGVTEGVVEMGDMRYQKVDSDGLGLPFVLVAVSGEVSVQVGEGGWEIAIAARRGNVYEGGRVVQRVGQIGAKCSGHRLGEHGSGVLVGREDAQTRNVRRILTFAD